MPLRVTNFQTKISSTSSHVIFYHHASFGLVFCTLSRFLNQNLIYDFARTFVFLVYAGFHYSIEKKEMRKSERHASLKRGARESVHPSARWSLFTMAMLIPRVFSDIDPNFTISMRSTNFSFFSHHSCRSNPWSCARYSSEQWHVPICRRGRSSTGRRKENRGVAGRLQWSSETGSC